VNVEGAINVVKACKAESVKRLLHVSSVAAVGLPDSPQLPANENFEFNLQNSGLIYHISKRRGEAEVMREVASGLNAIIVNPASVTDANRIEGLFASVRRFPVVPCFSGGNCVVHVTDVVEGIIAALERGRVGHRYILGGENLTFRAMGKKAAKALNLSRMFVLIPPIVTGLAAAVLEPLARRRNSPPKVSHMVHYCANRFMFYDSNKAHLELNYRPRNFDAILMDALRSAKEQ
jgi:dihydroflavonol-4-reductase